MALVSRRRAEEDDSESTPVEWLDELFTRAVTEGYTDLQFRLQRDESLLTVRARINRTMQTIATAEGRRAVEVITRVKANAGVSTAPAQSISDGLYQFNDGTTKHDFRVAVFPTHAGETIAIRLPSQKTTPSLDRIGLSDHNRARVDRLLGMANGLVLMAGPMGAGKTTTMYSLMQTLAGPDRSVFSVEDPVERHLDAVEQIQINEEAGNGWPAVLRGLRRSDCEVLMIGEIRDGQQASAALEIGNAGAKVISSIHSNDSVGAVHMLLELSDTPPRTLGNQLRGVISQRLIRTVCRDHTGPNCENCLGSGYAGVHPIHEVLIVDDALVDALVEGRSATDLRDVARSNGMTSLRENANELIMRGMTTADEVRRVLGLE